MGPTILTVPSVLRRIFGEAGRDVEDALELIPLDPQWRCFFDGGDVLDLYADQERMRGEVVAAAGPECWTGYERFLELASRFHQISEKFFFWRPVGSMWDTFDAGSTFRISTLREVLSMRLGHTVSGTIRSFIKDPRMAQMLDHYTQYIGSAPDQSPAILCAIAHMQNLKAFGIRVEERARWRARFSNSLVILASGFDLYGCVRNQLRIPAV